MAYGKCWLHTEILYEEGIKQFIKESDSISNIKWDIINALKKNNYAVPLSFSYATLLSYKNTNIVVGRNRDCHIKDFFNTFCRSHFEQFDTIIKRDDEERRKGKEVFYTSYPKEAYKMGYIDKKLQELIHEQELPNITLRVPSSKSINIKKFNSRQHLMLHGTFPDYDLTPENQYRLISANTTLFTNLNRSGESTFHYWIFNGSQKTPYFNAEMLFKKYNLENIYQRFQKKLESISIGSNGAILLQIIVDKKTADKAIYASWAGGIKRTDIQGTTIDMLNTIEQNPAFQSPHDQSLLTLLGLYNPTYVISNLQWRLIVTKSLINCRHTKIIPYTIHNNTNLEIFHKEIDKVFEEIRKEIQSIL